MEGDGLLPATKIVFGERGEVWAKIPCFSSYWIVFREHAADPPAALAGSDSASM
jgi:hypothetical protein